MELDVLSVHWSASLDAAEDALDAAEICLAADEERARRHALARERDRVTLLLEAIKREMR